MLARGMTRLSCTDFRAAIMIVRLRRALSVTQHFHGRILLDENRSFAHPNSLSLALFLKQEKTNFAQASERLHNIQHRILRKLESRTAPHLDVEPEQSGNYYYFSVSDPYFTLRRQEILKTGEIGPMETVFDTLDLPEVRGNPEIASAIGTPIVRISDNQQKAAFIADVNRNERPILGVKDLKTGKILEIIPNVCGAEWSKDGKCLYYSQPDHLNRPNVIKKHVLGTDFRKDEVVLEEKNESFYLDLSQTKDKKYTLLYSNSKTTTELWVIDRETGQMREIVHKKNGVRVFLEHNRGYFYLVTNENQCLDYKIMRIGVGQGLIHATDFIPYEVGKSIEEIDMFEHYLVVYYRCNGLPRVKVGDLKTGDFHEVQFDMGEEVFSVIPGVNLDYHSHSIRLQYSSPLCYLKTLEYDMKTRKLTTLKTTNLDGPSIHTKKFHCRRVDVPAHDGNTIPMTLFHNKSLQNDRKNRVVLKGYGAYGVFSDNQFKLAEMNAVEEGWVVATAHVRGDAEKGREWHEAAKFEHKRNSFEDFSSCAAYLIAEGYTKSKYLAAWGASAGGLLVAQTINRHPELFKAAVLEVPFVDVLNLMLDESQALTLPEREEWGDPLHDSHIFDEMRSYSPYENIWHTDYPALYITAGLRDPRVPYWSIAKYVKRLRQRMMPHPNPRIGKDNVIFEVSDSGHFGGGDKLKEEAFMWAFLGAHIPSPHLTLD